MMTGNTSQTPFDGSANWKQAVPTETLSITRSGLGLLALTFGIFMAWAAFVPLAGAVVSFGKVRSVGDNQVIQPPTSGAISEIAVQEGDSLKKGDLILRLESASAIASLAKLKATRNLLLAKQVRLTGEDDGWSIRTTRAEQLFVSDTQDFDNLVREQRTALEASNKRHQSEKSALENQLQSLETEFEIGAAQIKANRQLRAMTEERHATIAGLVKKGYSAKSHLWEIDKSLLEVNERLISLQGNQDRIKFSISEIEDKLSVLEAKKGEDTSKELTDVLAELESIDEQITAGEEAILHTEIRAPMDGTLTNFSANTIGGFVQAGSQIAEIVPTTREYVIETRIRPQDISSTYVGQKAKIMITAFSDLPEGSLEGEVTYVAADSTENEKSGLETFLVRARITSTKGIAQQLQPGMSAQIFLETESRTFLSYVLEPLTYSLRSAFRE